MARFDGFDRVIEIDAEGAAVTGDAARAAVVAAIDRALGDDSAGLARTEWQWQGGASYLQGEGARLTLRYDHDELHERVVYGLPNCP